MSWLICRGGAFARVLRQADKIIGERLAAANPRNDGRQTPWRNHPVFVAQHATATCCRGCLQKDHEIAETSSWRPTREGIFSVFLERWLQQYALEVSA